MAKHVILAIDQGTTGTRALLFLPSGKLLSSSYQEFKQYYPKPAWVEHDAEEIWQTTLKVIGGALRQAKLKSSQIVGIGITNQRETTVLWDRKTSRPVARAIVWQDRRTESFCESLKKKESLIRRKTGLVADAYFSGSKLHWFFTEKPNLAKKAKQGKLAFGTIDTWLLWKLTGGQVHATDATNASRTLLYNIYRQEWDDELLKLMKVPKSVLPEVKNSGGEFGVTVKQGPLAAGIPILGILGDQQAALYGQGCYRSGEFKNTYGTGCFILKNAGSKAPKPQHGLLTTVACDRKGRPSYALEGAIFIAGASVQWLRDGLEFFKDATETEKLALSVQDSHGVHVIPSFVGLGSPYWASHVRGVMTGLTRGSTKAHITRATLESLAHQTADVIAAMQSSKIKELRVDGGATHNRFLMQFQADLLGANVLVSDLAESTAWGVAKLAGRVAGFWQDDKKIDRRNYRVYKPKMGPQERKKLRNQWREQIEWLLKQPKGV